MSQPGRQVCLPLSTQLFTYDFQDFSDKVHNAVKPDSQKTFTEHAGDMLSGKADSGLSTLQPQGDKSLGQKAGDAISGQQYVSILRYNS